MLGPVKRLTKHLCISALLLLGIAIGSATAKPDLLTLAPKSPVSPTTDDCRAMNQKFGELLQEQHRQISACMNDTEPVIGWGLECSISTYQVFETKRAWPNCSSYEVTLCDLYSQRKTELDTCYARARQTQEAHEREEEQTAQAVANANKLYEAFNATQNLLADPRRFLETVLQKQVFKQIFPEGEKASPGDRYDLAQELYRYAHNQAKAGLERSPDPIIRAFQKNSLELVSREFRRTLGRLDEVVRQMAAFNLEEARSLQSAHPITAPAPPDGSVDCAVLDDFEESHRLMERDEQRWLDLVAACR